LTRELAIYSQEVWQMD